ncbi:MAG: extracellular solute-binding protein [Spirochaetaceae bacterium]|nr:MAG: extracellular solute-binding protein [Spirochaetaceae bacterium]
MTKHLRTGLLLGVSVLIVVMGGSVAVGLLRERSNVRVALVELSPEERTGVEAVIEHRQEGDSRSTYSVSSLESTAALAELFSRRRTRPDIVVSHSIAVSDPTLYNSLEPVTAFERRFSDPAVSSFTIDSHSYAIPLLWSPFGLYYSQPVFRRLGLQPPDTWSDFTSTIETLRASGVTPLLSASENSAFLSNLESYLKHNNFPPNHDRLDARVDALLERGILGSASPLLSEHELADLLLSESVGMVAASMQLQRHVDRSERLRITFSPLPLPGTGRPATVARIVGAGITPAGSAKPAAVALLDYLSAASTQEMIVQLSGPRITFAAVNPAARYANEEARTAARLLSISQQLIPERR